MTTVCDKIWRYDVGHYGGLFVDVPSEHLDSFKKMFPKEQIPRKIKLKTVQDVMTTYGEERFNKEFPRSMGRFANIFFSNRSKGLATLEKLLEKCPREQIDKKYSR